MSLGISTQNQTIQNAQLPKCSLTQTVIEFALATKEYYRQLLKVSTQNKKKRYQAKI